MKILGIIAEYNPFHNGHEYQIKKAKEISGADYIIAIMSGNYVQRGAPAIFDKSIRTRMALNSGIDAVFEIPALFSTASANDFAGYGISLLKILGADFISFGAENDNYKLLDTVAKVLTDKEQELAVKKHMEAGLNYAKARHNAILEELKGNKENINEIKKLLASPNNILAIEYLKSIRLNNVGIKPVIISRSGSGYHEKEIEENKFSSATAIRRLVSESNFDIFNDSIKSAIPDKNINLFKNSKSIFDDDFLFTVQRSILDKLSKGEDLSAYCDVSKELANTVEKNIFELENKSYSDFILKLKSKNFTYTRISRAIFHLLLNHKKNMLEDIKSEKNMAAYPLFLGFKKEASELLSELKKRSELPIVSKMSNAKDILSPVSLKIFENNIYSDFIYNSIYFEKHGEKLCNPYRRNVVIV
ncbi:nucleotidyltransferase family protein [Lachnoanaerobaculum gingivalis]|uniref:tRNA(Met) cytidine acetate ligase n=1 Tax=Lachnoanaerobaculum gingivalis TaxID=2490855 RepID=UPI0024A71409|nr:nucleotidyltransferase family protein [Lachnoanaerobaculum gingivalis]WHE86233.1 nucleotidyltransferase family protein [Lachnoanaerobaculum gingivalis]